MKKFIIATLFLLSVNSYAQSTASGHTSSTDRPFYQFQYRGQPQESFKLSVTTIETEYQNQVVNTTCQEQVSYQTEECGYQTTYEPQPCYTTKPTKKCEVINGKLECHVVPGETICPPPVAITKWVCTPVTKYYIREYPCQKTVQVAVGSYNKRYVADINFQFDYNNIYSNVLVKAQLNYDGSLQITANNQSGEPVVLMAKETIKESGNKYISFKQITYQTKVYERDGLLAPLMRAPQNAFFDRNNLYFDLDRVIYPERFKFRIEVANYNVVPLPQQYRLQNSYYSTRAIVNLANVGINLKPGMYDLKITAEFDFGDLKILSNDFIPPMQKLETRIRYR